MRKGRYPSTIQDRQMRTSYSFLAVAGNSFPQWTATFDNLPPFVSRLTVRAFCR